MHSPHPLVYFGQLFAMASYNGELIFIGKNRSIYSNRAISKQSGAVTYWSKHTVGFKNE